MLTKKSMVNYLDSTEPLDCPYGHVSRIITGGEGGIANVHVVRVTKGTPHRHTGYDEVFYVLSGTGYIRLGGDSYEIRPGAVAVIPRNTEHSIASDTDAPIEFIIFGTPPMAMDDERAAPKT